MTPNIGNKKNINTTVKSVPVSCNGTELDVDATAELEFNTFDELFNITVEFKSKGIA